DLPTGPVPRTPPAMVLMFGRRPGGWSPPPGAGTPDPSALPATAELQPPLIGVAAVEPPQFDLSSHPPPPIPPEEDDDEVGAGVSVEEEAAAAAAPMPAPNAELEAAVFGTPEETASDAELAAEPSPAPAAPETAPSAPVQAAAPAKE